METQLTKSEEIAFLTVLEKRIKERLDEVKGEERQSLMETFADTHCDRKALMVGDTKVGEIVISLSTPKPVIKPECMSQALRELDGAGLVDLAPSKGWEDHFALVGDQIVWKDTGEVCDWLMWQPSMVKTASVRGIKGDKVKNAFGARLASINPVGLLEGE